MHAADASRVASSAQSITERAFKKCLSHSASRHDVVELVLSGIARAAQ
jgi:hypothetical protein